MQTRRSPAPGERRAGQVGAVGKWHSVWVGAYTDKLFPRCVSVLKARGFNSFIQEWRFWRLSGGERAEQRLVGMCGRRKTGGARWWWAQHCL